MARKGFILLTFEELKLLTYIQTQCGKHICLAPLNLKIFLVKHFVTSSFIYDEPDNNEMYKM